MIRAGFVSVWGLLLAAPFFAASSDAAKLLSFTLDETQADVARVLGRPAATFEQGAYFVWQYFLIPGDTHDPSHILCFRRSDGKLVSVTRNSHEEQDVEALFPAGSWTVHLWPDKDKPQYGARSRRLGKDRVLVAMGSRKPGDPTRQLVLIRESAVPNFLPWLASAKQ